MKPNVMLFGRYANRTPVAYQAYVPLFSEHVHYVYDPNKADILVSGSVRDFDAHHDFIISLVLKKPSLKLVVVSEEPFWDTIWGGRFYERESISEKGLRYFNINHTTSRVFHFEKIPYFLTTDDRFVTRYALAFKRNAQYSPSELLAHFQSAQLTFAALAEKRMATRYDVTLNIEDDSGSSYVINGLCRYRSLATQEALKVLPESAVEVRGRGWSNQRQKRQELDDWHLDKLITFDKRAKFFSAIENTDQPFYITEKLFDAYAMLSVPVVCHTSDQYVKRLCGSCSTLNLVGKQPGDLPDALQSFKFDIDFVSEFALTMQVLASLFTTPGLLASERSGMVTRLVTALNHL